MTRQPASKRMNEQTCCEGSRGEKKFKFRKHRKRFSSAEKTAIQLDLIDDSNNNNSELLKREQRT